MTVPADQVWGLTPHVCLNCLGRVLEAVGQDGAVTYRCSNCGVEAEGRKGAAHPPICACGAKLGRRDAGIRCVANERQRPELPSEIVAREVA